MNQRNVLLAFILVGCVFAGYILGMVFPNIASLLFPSPHQAVMNRITVKEPDYQTFLSYRLLSSVDAKYGQIVPYSFTSGRVYHSSCWLVTRFGDPELVISIWGPGDDSRTYDVEVGRLGTALIEVYWDGTVKLSFAEIPSRVPGQLYSGYGVFSVTL